MEYHAVYVTIDLFNTKMSLPEILCLIQIDAFIIKKCLYARYPIYLIQTCLYARYPIYYKKMYLREIPYLL